jgi:hypothetical protein
VIEEGARERIAVVEETAAIDKRHLTGIVGARTEVREEAVIVPVIEGVRVAKQQIAKQLSRGTSLCGDRTWSSSAFLGPTTANWTEVFSPFSQSFPCMAIETKRKAHVYDGYCNVRQRRQGSTGG